MQGMNVNLRGYCHRGTYKAYSPVFFMHTLSPKNRVCRKTRYGFSTISTKSLFTPKHLAS